MTALVEPDALGPRRRRREDDRWRRRGVVRPVVLADAEHVEADLVGEFDLFDEVAKAIRLGLSGRNFREGKEAEFHA